MRLCGKARNRKCSALNSCCPEHIGAKSFSAFRHAAMPVLVEAEADGTRVVEESAVLSNQA
jgi:hypothetical protein